MIISPVTMKSIIVTLSLLGLAQCHCMATSNFMPVSRVK